MPSNEFNILEHFGVTLGGAAARTSAAQDSIILAPREKAPRALGWTPQRSSTRSGSAAPPSLSQAIILDAPVPCNDYVNEQAAIARRRRREQQLQQERQAAAREEDLFAARDERVHQMTAAQKAALRHELERAAEQAKAAKRMRRRQELSEEVHTTDASAAEEAAVRLAMERKNKEKLRIELQHRAAEARAARVAQRRAASADPGAFVEPVYLQSLQDEAGRAERLKQRQAELQRFWEDQVKLKQQRSAAARRSEKLFAAEADAMAEHEETRTRAETAATRMAIQRNLQVVEAQRAERRARLADDRARERADAAREQAMAIESARLESELKRQKQHQLRDDIARLMAQRRAERHSRAEEERRRERHNVAASEAAALRDANVLYRCPATGRVLPGAAFNIPRTAWQAPSRSVIM